MAGCGGTVTQPLPLLDLVEPPAVAPGDSTKVLPSLRGLSVLVVDDALDARDSLAMFLEECGARVTAVASAAEAPGARWRSISIDRFGRAARDGGPGLRTPPGSSAPV